VSDGFSMVQRVRFGDLDAMQHMNNVEFLRFFETARIDFITQLAPEHHPGSPNGFGFIFAECHIAYRAPAHYNEEIRTWIRPAELRRSSLKLDFEMRVEGDGRLVAEGWGTLVGYDYEAGKAHPIPDVFRARVEPLLAASSPEGVG
jgi:acyl-CoA thioester hydrolase